MKKFYFLLCALFAGAVSFAQTIPGGDMDNWRTGTAGGGFGHTAVTIEAPTYWYGVDSLIIADGQLYGGFLMLSDASWNRQIFMESTIIHGGAHSAKIVTVADSVLGVFPGILANAKANIEIDPFTMSAGAPSFTGGMPMPAGLRPATVSAWVEYFSGVDSLGAPGIDTGVLTVQALTNIHGYDSVIGNAVVFIPPGSSWAQITANIIYPPQDSLLAIDTVRITFTSSGGAGTPLYNSTLYVDDVTMTSIPQLSHVGVNSIATGGEDVNVYPNPASGIIYFNSPQNAGLSCQLLSVNGAVVAAKALAGNDAIDISILPAGLYFYAVYNERGTAIQRGKIAVSR